MRSTTATANSGTVVPGSAAELLRAVREHRQTAERCDVELMELSVAWADLHPADSDFVEACFQSPKTLAGEGSPVIDEFCIPELATMLGRTCDSTGRFLTECIELAHRLPRLWAAVRAGRVTGWRARMIAAATVELSQVAAAFVDEQTHWCANRVTTTQLRLLVEQAMVRHMPEAAAEVEERSWDQRHVTFYTDQVGFDGTIRLEAAVEIPDALALRTAVADGAAHLAALGSTDSIDGRRATALGDLARTQLAFGFDDPTGDDPTGDDPAGDDPAGDDPAGDDRSGDDPATDDPDSRDGTGDSDDMDYPGTGDPGTDDGLDGDPVWPDDGDRAGGSGGDRSLWVRPVTPVTQIVLHAHLSADALIGTGGSSLATPSGDTSVRLEEVGGRVLSVDLVRAWCARSDVHVVVRPVIDLHQPLHTPGYRPTAAIREHVIARDGTCCFPWCGRNARACDLDHVIAYDHAHPDAGGATSTANLAPLCRRHHRLKTRGRWRYESPEPGVYIWTSPLGWRYRRDHTGSQPLPPTPNQPDGPTPDRTDRPGPDEPGRDEPPERP